MKHTRYLAAALVAFGLAACSGGTPTATDPDVTPRFDAGGGWIGSGTRAGGTGGVMDSTEPPPPPPADTTSLVGGGFIGSGT